MPGCGKEEGRGDQYRRHGGKTSKLTQNGRRGTVKKATGLEHTSASQNVMNNKRKRKQTEKDKTTNGKKHKHKNGQHNKPTDREKDRQTARQTDR